MDHEALIDLSSRQALREVHAMKVRSARSIGQTTRQIRERFIARHLPPPPAVFRANAELAAKRRLWSGTQWSKAQLLELELANRTTPLQINTIRKGIAWHQ